MFAFEFAEFVNERKKTPKEKGFSEDVAQKLQAERMRLKAMKPEDWELLSVAEWEQAKEIGAEIRKIEKALLEAGYSLNRKGGKNATF